MISALSEPNWGERAKKVVETIREKTNEFGDFIGDQLTIHTEIHENGYDMGEGTKSVNPIIIAGIVGGKKAMTTDLLELFGNYRIIVDNEPERALHRYENILSEIKDFAKGILI